MKSSEILRRAAERIADGRHEGCCYAILESAPTLDMAYKKARYYFMQVGPVNADPLNCWFGCVTEKNIPRRVIALCLAAAIAESEGD